MTGEVAQRPPPRARDQRDLLAIAAAHGKVAAAHMANLARTFGDVAVAAQLLRARRREDNGQA